MIVDLLSDFGADMEVIGLGNKGKDDASILADIEMVDIENKNWEWYEQSM